jgi:rhamnosyltransferase
MAPQPSPPRVAVLLASYNGARFLSDQVATIVHQQGVTTSLFLRDDGSTDATPILLDGLGGKEVPDVTVMKGGKQTGSAAANFLRMLAEADFGDASHVALSDQDDLWLGNKLRRAVDCLARSGAGGYSANLCAFDNDGQRRPWLLLKHGPQKPFDHFFQGASAGCTYVLTRSSADALQQWLQHIQLPEGLGVSHDWLIYAFVRNRGLGWFCDDVAPILYRQHSGNVYGSRRGLSDLMERVRLLRRRWYRRHVLWIASQLDLSPAERALVRRIERLNPLDRLWLVSHAGRLRRRSRDILMLRLALLTGLF